MVNPGLLVPSPSPEQLAGGRWQALPPLPSGQLAPRNGAAVVWTGREVLAGAVEEPGAGSDVVAGAYDPAANRWRVLPQGPTATGGGSHLRARLPAAPGPAARPPLRSLGTERALLRTRERASGAVQVYVLVPARPPQRR